MGVGIDVQRQDQERVHPRDECSAGFHRYHGETTETVQTYDAKRRTQSEESAEVGHCRKKEEMTAENKMEGCNETRLRAGGEMDRATWKARWKDATRQD